MKHNIRNFVSTAFVFFALLLSTIVLSVPSDHFVTTWNTTSSGGTHSITIPTKSGLTYNYSIDWDNDGTFDDFNVAGDATHNYAIPGTKTIRLVGNFPRLFINNGSERLKIKSIEQWGTNPWTSMRNAFYGAANLINNASDTPNLSNVQHLHAMFREAVNIGAGSANWAWTTTGVTDMSNMFQNTAFDHYVGSWDTSSVTTFKEMFFGATSYDRGISNWNVEASTDFTDMFLGVTLSTGNYEALLISWANQNINNGLSFNGGFSKYCSNDARTARNSLIFGDGLSISDFGLCDEGYFITTWKTDNPGTSNSTSITIPTEPSEIYNYQVDWNGDGDFNDTDENINYTGNATHDYGVAGTYTIKIKGIFPRIYFGNSGDKEKILSIDQWGTRAWTSMHGAFYGANNIRMNAADTPNFSETIPIGFMFKGTNNLGMSTGNWNWDTSSVIDMIDLFSNSTFDFDISNWNVEAVNYFDFMFTDSTLSAVNYDALLISWDAQTIKPDKTFDAGNSQYCSQAAQDARASIIANDGWTINDGGLDPNCDTSILENHFVITVDTTIAGATASNVFEIPTTGTGYNYSIDSNNDGTFNFIGVTGNANINYGTGGIKTIRIAGDFPRIYFNESGDKDKILSIEQWGTNHWTSMNNAFSGASNLVINATDTPDLSNVSSLFAMFKNASSIGNGSSNWNWNTSAIHGMANMFQNAVNFNQDISSWNIENVTNLGGMFTGATLSVANYDALLISWDGQNVNPSLTFGGGNSKYCSPAAVTAHANLITTDLWSINDGGFDSNCDLIDLQLQITSTAGTVNAGDLVDIVFTISNNGNSDAINAVVQDLLPIEVVSTTWICNATGTAFCPASGSSTLNETVTVPNDGSSLTYTVSATVTSDSFSQLEYSARVLAGNSQSDTDNSNNHDTIIHTNGDIIFANSFEPMTKVRKFGKLALGKTILTPK